MQLPPFQLSTRAPRWDPLQRYISDLTINTVIVRFKITKPGITGTPLARISQLIDNLSCMRFLQLSYNFLTTSLWVVCDVFEKSMRSMRNLWGSQTHPFKKDPVARWSRSPTDLSMRSMSLIDKSVPVAGSRVGLGGFKPTHFQKRHPWVFPENC